MRLALVAGLACCACGLTGCGGAGATSGSGPGTAAALPSWAAGSYGAPGAAGSPGGGPSAAFPAGRAPDPVGVTFPGTVLARHHATRAVADPALLPSQLNWQLPEQVRVRSGYGVRAGAGYAVFGVGPGDPRGGDAEIASAERARFAVLDLRTGELTVRPAVDAGRTADAAAPVTDASGRGWVVRTEAGPRPPAECPATPDYCWTWTLYATVLPSGDSLRIATATRPGPQFLLPQVATDGHTAAWLDASASADGGDTALMVWRPGATATAVAGGLPMGRLSLDAGAAWIGTADRDGHRLLRADLGTGRAASSALPAGAGEGVVTAGSVAYVHRPPDDAAPGTPTTVEVAPVTALGSARQVFAGPDVYTLNWAAGRVVVSSNSGYLITDGRTTRGLGLDLLSGVHNDAGRLALVQRRGGRQVVVITSDPDG